MKRKIGKPCRSVPLGVFAEMEDIMRGDDQYMKWLTRFMPDNQCEDITVLLDMYAAYCAGRSEMCMRKK